MFDVGWSELLVIAIVLIVVVGPKDLPRMLRAFGKTTARMRSMAGEFRTQFDEALKEADLDEVRKTISDAQQLNPTKSLRDAMNPLRQVGDEIRASLDEVVKPNSITKPSAEDAEMLSSIETAEPAPLVSEPIVSDAASVPQEKPTRKRTTRTPRAPKPKAAAASKVEPVATAEAAPVKAPRKTARKAPAKSANGAAAAKPAANGAAMKTSAKKPAAKPAAGAAAKAPAEKPTAKTSAARPKASPTKPAKRKAPATKAAPKAAAAKTVAEVQGSPDVHLNGAGNTDNS